MIFINQKTYRVYFFILSLIAALAIAGCDSSGSGNDLGPGPDGGPDVVSLGSAGNYVILAKTGVSTTGTTAITGDVGVSPAGYTELTGFSLTPGDNSGVFSTSTYVTGKLYASNYAVPTPSNLTAAIGDMETAYTTAAGLTVPAATTELGSGEIGGMTIEPGLYKWGTGVGITTDVTLWGSDTARWVFQIAQDLTVASGARVTLAGGALPENILWQVGSNAMLGTTSVFTGTLMTGTDIAVRTGAAVNGRLFAKTAVTLDANAVTQP